MAKQYQFEPALLSYDNEMERFLVEDWPTQRTTPTSNRIQQVGSFLLLLAVVVTVALTLIFKLAQVPR